jgi:hypothetical protein
VQDIHDVFFLELLDGVQLDHAGNNNQMRAKGQLPSPKARLNP